MIKRCISLKRATHRRQVFTKNWVDGVGFDIAFFDAVDKYSLADSEIKSAEEQVAKLSFSPYGVFDNSAYSLPGIIACSRSHLELLKSILDSVGDDGVVIFEDDVVPLDGAKHLEGRIAMARKHFPQVESIICNGFIEPRSMHGVQLLNELLQGQKIFWDEKIHASPIEGAMASVVKISPPGSFFNWYSRDGIERMIKLIEGREFFGTDLMYAAFAHQGVLAILTPGLGYHPPKSEVGSFIESSPITIHEN